MIRTTGEWEAVYNLRAADHHTYFVGEEGWGWSAGVHNRYDAMSKAIVTTLGHRTDLPSDRLAGLEGLQRLARRQSLVDMTEERFLSDLSEAFQLSGVQRTLARAT